MRGKAVSTSASTEVAIVLQAGSKLFGQTRGRSRGISSRPACSSPLTQEAGRMCVSARNCLRRSSGSGVELHRVDS